MRQGLTKNAGQFSRISLAIFLYIDRNVLVTVAEVLEHTLQTLWISRHVDWNKLYQAHKLLSVLLAKQEAQRNFTSLG